MALLAIGQDRSGGDQPNPGRKNRGEPGDKDQRPAGIEAACGKVEVTERPVLIGGSVLPGHFGIDNLDLAQSLQLLQSGQFDYVKINASTLHEMGREDMSAGYQALRTITDTLDIDIIAVAVDSQQVFDELKALGIDQMQGNYFGSPEAV